MTDESHALGRLQRGYVAAVQDALNQIGANAALPVQQTPLPLLVPDGAFGNKTYHSGHSVLRVYRLGGTESCLGTCT